METFYNIISNMKTQPEYSDRPLLTSRVFRNRFSFIKLYDNPVHITEAVKDIDSEFGNYVYIRINGTDFMFIVNSDKALFNQIVEALAEVNFDLMLVKAIGRLMKQPQS